MKILYLTNPHTVKYNYFREEGYLGNKGEGKKAREQESKTNISLIFFVDFTKEVEGFVKSTRHLFPAFPLSRFPAFSIVHKEVYLNG